MSDGEHKKSANDKDESSSKKEPLIESNKQHALVMFATILAITGVGFALWFNFSDQGQHIIRQFNKGKNNEEEERDISLRPMGDRKLKWFISY